MGIDAVGSTSAEFHDYLVAERERFARMYSFTGLTPE
jgi:hypothetical protein